MGGVTCEGYRKQHACERHCWRNSWVIVWLR